MTTPRITLALLLLVPLAASAAAPMSFKDVSGIFKKHCVECHSEATGKKKAGYAFDDIKVLKTDVDDRGIIRPGDPEASRVIECITSGPDADNHMPPKGNGLSKAEIEKLKKWIKEGAILDPKDAAPTSALPEKATPATTTGTTPAPTAPPHFVVPPPVEWKNAEGKIISASFLKLAGDTLHLRAVDGKMYKVPLAKLAPESQQQAKDLEKSPAK
jgi:mono/diheme cytochrome c family protein